MTASLRSRLAGWTSLLSLSLILPATALASVNPLPPQSNAHGASYGEWSARQWQWLYSLPTSAHPLFDTTDDCGAGQEGRVWFLGGTYIPTEEGPEGVFGKATRRCEVPPGTALFFPIIDAECSKAAGEGDTAEQLRACARETIDHVVAKTLEVDGVAIDLERFRVTSPMFEYGPLPADNARELPEGTKSWSVSDGYFVMLPPLSRGTHTIHFTGRAEFPDPNLPEPGFVFALDITYEIVVR